MKVLDAPPVRLVRLVVSAALLLGACNGGGGDDDDTLPPPVSTTVDYSVPEVIDVAYVEKVMAALDHVYGDAIRILAREREITKDFLEHLAAIYTPKQFAFWQDVWVKDLASGLAGLRPRPGDTETEIQEIVISTAECVLVRVDRDFSATNEEADRTTPQEFIALVPGGTKRALNPTPWVLSFDGYVASPPGAQPDKPCVVS